MATTDPNRPRFLTAAEITSFLDSVFPTPGKPAEPGQAEPVLSKIPAIQKVVTENLRSLLRYQLSSVRITPLAIPDLVARTVRAYNRARVPPKTSVGIKSGEALGGPVTQMALNSFHQSGAGKNIGSGIDQLRLLLNLGETKYPSCTIHLKNKNHTPRELLSLRKEFTSITLDKLTSGYEIMHVDVEEDDQWWVDAHRAAAPEHLDGVGPWHMRVRLNVAMLLEYGITMDHIRYTFEHGKEMNRVVTGPLRTGVFYLFINPEFIAKFVENNGDAENIVMIYLESVVLPKFATMTFRGIPGVTRVLTAVAKTVQIIAEEVATATLEQLAAMPVAERSVAERSWLVLLNAATIKISGIPAQRLLDLFEACGIVVTEVVSELAVRVRTPTAKRPSAVVAEQVEADKSGHLELASSYNYLETEGSSLLSMLVHPLVDAYYSYSNEILRMYELFGIEAARNLWIFLFKQALEDAGEYTDPRHVVLVADILFNQGRPNGISARGINRQRNSVLSRMSFDKAMSVIANGAFMGTLDDVVGVSSSIMIGRQGEFGTGAIDVMSDPETEKKMLDELKTRRKKVSVEDLEAELAQLALGGAAPVAAPAAAAVAGADEDEMFGAPVAVAPEPAPAPAAKATKGAVATDVAVAAAALTAPPPVVSQQLLTVVQNVAMMPVLAQGVDTLVFIKQNAKGAVRFFRPPPVALVAADGSGATSYQFDVPKVVAPGTVAPIDVDAFMQFFGA